MFGDKKLKQENKTLKTEKITIKNKFTEFVKNHSGKLFFICVLVVCIIVMSFVMYDVGILHPQRKQSFINKLESHNTQVKQGIIKTPSLIVVLNETEFINKALELSSIVYCDNYYFYVFEPNMLTAYMYMVR